MLQQGGLFTFQLRCLFDCLISDCALSVLRSESVPSVALAYIDHVEEYCDTGVGMSDDPPLDI